MEEHDARLRKTLENLREEGLTLNKEKCVFTMSELTFMGYLLSSKGIGPTESRVEAVMNAKEPQNAGGGSEFPGTSELQCSLYPQFSNNNRANCAG